PAERYEAVNALPESAAAGPAPDHAQAFQLRWRALSGRHPAAHTGPGPPSLVQRRVRWDRVAAWSRQAPSPGREVRVQPARSVRRAILRRADPRVVPEQLAGGGVLRHR